MLPQTDQRDDEQVVLHWSKKSLGTGDRKSDHYIVMVDQLWLWVFGGKIPSAHFESQPDNKSDTVITSFPQKWGQAGQAYDDGVLGALLKYLDSENRPPITSVNDLVTTITVHCSNVFDRSRDTGKLPLHEYFESSIGTLVGERSPFVI